MTVSAWRCSNLLSGLISDSSDVFPFMDMYTFALIAATKINVYVLFRWKKLLVVPSGNYLLVLSQNLAGNKDGFCHFPGDIRASARACVCVGVRECAWVCGSVQGCAGGSGRVRE